MPLAWASIQIPGFAEDAPRSWASSRPQIAPAIRIAICTLCRPYSTLPGPVRRHSRTAWRSPTSSGEPSLASTGANQPLCTSLSCPEGILGRLQPSKAPDQGHPTGNSGPQTTVWTGRISPRRTIPRSTHGEPGSDDPGLASSMAQFLSSLAPCRALTN